VGCGWGTGAPDLFPQLLLEVVSGCRRRAGQDASAGDTGVAEPWQEQVVRVARGWEGVVGPDRPSGPADGSAASTEQVVNLWEGVGSAGGLGAIVARFGRENLADTVGQEVGRVDAGHGSFVAGLAVEEGRARGTAAAPEHELRVADRVGISV